MTWVVLSDAGELRKLWRREVVGGNPLTGKMRKILSSLRITNDVWFC
jgi:hypothetical protein